jgi:hypothetical protein
VNTCPHFGGLMCRDTGRKPVWKAVFRLTSSGRRRSRRECLVGRPRSPLLREWRTNSRRESPAGGLLCDRPLPGRCRSSPPSTSSAYERCLPESRPKAERFTPVVRRKRRCGLWYSSAEAEHSGRRAGAGPKVQVHSRHSIWSVGWMFEVSGWAAHSAKSMYAWIV